MPSRVVHQTLFLNRTEHLCNTSVYAAPTAAKSFNAQNAQTPATTPFLGNFLIHLGPIPTPKIFYKI
jgi:hypothetical protein